MTIDREKLHLCQQWIASDNIYCLQQVDSTITFLKTLSINNPPVLCLAEQQQQGRGRLGKPWYSPAAENIYASLLLDIEKPLEQLSGLSLVIALALIDGLKNAGISHNIQVKWPNDLLYQQQKLAGILLNTLRHDAKQSRLMISFGLNVNMTEAKIIDQAWTSLSRITGEKHDRHLIINHIIENIFQKIDVFTEYGFAKFHQQWQQYDATQDKMTTIKINQDTVRGVYLGVNEQGYVLLRDESGVLHTIYSGVIT